MIILIELHQYSSREAIPTLEKLILQAKAVNIKTFIVLEIQREKIEKEKTKGEKSVKS